MTDDDVRMRQVLSAAEHGDLDVIKRYLAGNPPLAEYSFIPLVRALAFGQDAIVREIVEHAGDDAFKHAPHVVEIAYRNKDWDMVRYLVEKGAEPRLRNGIGLFHILNDAPLDVIKVLIGAEDSTTKSTYKNTLFMLTLARHAGKSMEGREDLLDWALSESKLDLDAKRRFFIETINISPHFILLLKKHGFYFEDDPDYKTPLLRAVEKNSLEALEALIACGADLYARNGEAFDLCRAQPDRAPLLQKLQEALACQTEQIKAGFVKNTVEDFTADDFIQAARAGIFPQLAKDFAAAGRKISSVEVTHFYEGEPHLLGILQTRRELEALLDCRLWKNPESDFNLLATALTGDCRDDFQKAAAQELQRMHAEEKIDSIRRIKSGKGKFRL